MGRASAYHQASSASCVADNMKLAHAHTHTRKSELHLIDNWCDFNKYAPAMFVQSVKPAVEGCFESCNEAFRVSVS